MFGRLIAVAIAAILRGKLMIDIGQLLAELMEGIRSPDFPDTMCLANLLDLDVSQAKISTAKAGMSINRARLSRSGTEISIVCGILPRREIWLIFDNPLLPYREIKGQIFGNNQRIEPSKLSAGFGVLFEIDGWTCGYTASSPDGYVDSLFCEEAETVVPSDIKIQTA